MAQQLDNGEGRSPRKVLDKVADGAHVWHAHGPGGCGIRHCSSQVLGVLEVVGNGQHDLHLIATAGHHMVTVQGLLDEEWKAGKLLLHNCLDDVPIPALMAHLVENGLLPLAFAASIHGQLALAHGLEVLMSSCATGHDCFAEHGQVAAAQGQEPFLASWTGQLVLGCLAEHLVGLHLLLFGLWLCGQLHGHCRGDLAKVWPSGQNLGTLVMAVMP